MKIELWQLFFTVVAYLGALFLVAYAAERGWIARRLLEHPLVYVLSLGVYATSWTYYGSVGLAAKSGYTFLTIYLGVTLTFIMAPILLNPTSARVTKSCWRKCKLSRVRGWNSPQAIPSELCMIFRPQ